MPTEKAVVVESTSHLKGDLRDLETSGHTLLEDLEGVVLLGNLLHEVNVLLAVGLEGVLGVVGVVVVLPLHATIHGDGVLLDVLTEGCEALTGLNLLVLTLDHHLDLEENGVVLLTVEAEHVATLLHTVLGDDFRDSLEDTVKVKVTVRALDLPVLDKLVTQLEDLLVDVLLVLEGDGEDNVANYQS